MFQPNDKVVCINGDFRFSVFGIPASQFHTPQGVPREGQVYCVRAVNPGEAGTQGLFLIGVSTFLLGREVGFNSTRFRKVERTAHDDLVSEKDTQPVPRIEPA
jgi:hypothetical protein